MRKTSVFISLLIIFVAIIAPSMALILAQMKVYKYPILFFYFNDPHQPIGPVMILLFSFMMLELIFGFLWCPFRRWTISSCNTVHCSLLKSCKNCNVRLSLRQRTPMSFEQRRKEGRYYVRICENCDIVTVGFLSFICLMPLLFWEQIILRG
jgi:hypothetical protein